MIFPDKARNSPPPLTNEQIDFWKVRRDDNPWVYVDADRGHVTTGLSQEAVMVTAMIVDDESDIRALVRMVVEAANHGLAVAGEAADGDEALRMWRADPPVVMILDNRMPGLTGLEVAEQILAENPEQQIILFSAFLDAETIERADRIGIRRCMEKTQIDQLPSELWALDQSA